MSDSTSLHFEHHHGQPALKGLGHLSLWGWFPFPDLLTSWKAWWQKQGHDPLPVSKHDDEKAPLTSQLHPPAVLTHKTRPAPCRHRSSPLAGPHRLGSHPGSWFGIIFSPLDRELHFCAHRQMLSKDELFFQYESLGLSQARSHFALPALISSFHLFFSPRRRVRPLLCSSSHTCN